MKKKQQQQYINNFVQFVNNGDDDQLIALFSYCLYSIWGHFLILLILTNLKEMIAVKTIVIPRMDSIDME